VQTRLRKAELAEAEARARGAGEARRRLALALAGTVLLAVTLGAGGVLWLQAGRQSRRAQLQARQAELTREVNDALNEVAALRERARAATADSATLFAQAREQAQRALALVQAGPADEALQAQVRRVQGELDEEEKGRQFLAALDNARLGQVDTVAVCSADGVWDSRFVMERVVPLFRETFRAYGLPAGEGEPAAAAERLRQRPPPVREAALAALGEWIDLAANPWNQIREPHLDWLRAVAAGGGRRGDVGDACGQPGGGPGQTAGGAGETGGRGRRAQAAPAHSDAPGKTAEGRPGHGQRGTPAAAGPPAVPGRLLGEP
jgi:hypothetical protein